jgi:ATP-dependent DNA helicase RecG
MIICAPQNYKDLPGLRSPLTSLKGIGAKRASLLAQRGLYCVLDLLFFTPIRYEDRTKILAINQTEEGTFAWTRGQVVLGREERAARTGRHLFRIIVKDETGSLNLIWFHYKKAHLRSFSREGAEVLVYGKVQFNRGQRQMVHPEVRLAALGGESESLGHYPVYPAVNGVSMQTMRLAVRQALEKHLHQINDPIPGDRIRRIGLPGLADAIEGVHRPPEGSTIDLLNTFKTRCHQRLVFDQFFQVMLCVVSRKRFRDRRMGHRLTIPEDLTERLRKSFPFALTHDQTTALQEILKDLQSGKPMNRLLLGDVACGKTAVAVSASYITVSNGLQVAVMAPTQVLAQQQYAYFSGLSEKMGFRPVLLTGSLKVAERREVGDKIRSGQHNIVIGTHALIQEQVSFACLGLAVIDEQHRFGVRQRLLLDSKGADPHLLVMTATPIPRTLAMTVYADLDMSVIKEYPKGHRPVRTHLVKETQKRELFEILIKKLSEHEQAIVICPVIEASGDLDLKNAVDMYVKLTRLLSPRFNVDLIHGRMSAGEKTAVMERFRRGAISLLVGTSVIEVGVHAPGATVMIIEHPERFGLTQLHQLRGRVGRGSKRGLCMLMLSEGVSEESLSRLRALVETSDGFEIARKDLEMRGQGELMGTRQSGRGDLDLRMVFREPELLMTAKGEAEALLDFDPELRRPEHLCLRKIVESGSATPSYS